MPEQLPSYIADCPVVHFIYDWQILVTGILALVAAFGTIWVTRVAAQDQVSATNEHARATRELARLEVDAAREQTAELRRQDQEFSIRSIA